MEAAVLGGTANPALAQTVAAALDLEVVPVEARRFPDGEAYVRVEGPLAGTAIIVQSSHPDTALVELLLLQDAAREAGARRVVSVVPYMGYARQDRAFQHGEAISSRAVARAVAAGTDAIITVDPHKDSILDFYGGKATAASAVAPIAHTLRAWGVDAVLAPDRGAMERAERVAALLDVRCDHLEKKRVSATEVRIAARTLDVAGCRVAIVDDLIASGGTMASATGHLKAQGAAAVHAACTHGLFTDGAVARMRAAGIDRILCTDTVEGADCDVVSAAAPVAAAVASIAGPV